MNVPTFLPLFILVTNLLHLNAQAKPVVAEEVEVEFNFFYRSTPQSKSEAKRFALKVPIVEGDVLDIPLGITGKAEFKGMFGTVIIGYNSIKIQFLGTKGLISETLFQIDNAPTNTFSGGHGFTGLHYVYDTISGAQIQFFAKVQDKDNQAEPQR